MINLIKSIYYSIYYWYVRTFDKKVFTIHTWHGRFRTGEKVVTGGGAVLESLGHNAYRYTMKATNQTMARDLMDIMDKIQVDFLPRLAGGALPMLMSSEVPWRVEFTRTHFTIIFSNTIRSIPIPIPLLDRSPVHIADWFQVLYMTPDQNPPS